MAGTFYFQVVSPEGAVLDADVQFVALPATEGELGILPRHTPLIASLKSGVIRYTVDDEVKKMAISGGFAEVEHNHVTVLAETAELADSIDMMRAEAAKTRAEKRLKDRVSNVDVARAEASLRRAISRLQARK
ncbi:MAG: F0F1 ATP synthase subunit epsilon [Peptococcaceae bacterium]|jgi:F-type H+-transporting ATPase subunit epsilon|nr:F0F1 ATP synthase subunit epsilon [Peptococcaceae bacterium]